MERKVVRETKKNSFASSKEKEILHVIQVGISARTNRKSLTEKHVNVRKLSAASIHKDQAGKVVKRLRRNEEIFYGLIKLR